MPELRVVDPGLFASIQDAGRFGYRRFGVPWSGVLDTAAAQLANALADNQLAAAVIEFFQNGLTLQLLDASVRLAVVGDCLLTLKRGGKRCLFRAGRSVTLQAGDTLQIGRVHSGKVGYVAVHGGFSLPAVLGSRSTYQRAGFGGLDGDLLRVGACLPVAATSQAGGNRYLPASSWMGEENALPQSLRPPRTLRVIMGPQDDFFTAAACETLLSEVYQVGHDSDRMGCRLSGPHLQHDPVRGAEIISDGVVPGAIQVPGSGAPIVLLADGPTVGGYPKIATVISSDLPALATMMPGVALRFKAVSVDEAEVVLRARHAALAAKRAAIMPLPLISEPFDGMPT